MSVVYLLAVARTTDATAGKRVGSDRHLLSVEALVIKVGAGWAVVGVVAFTVNLHHERTTMGHTSGTLA